MDIELRSKGLLFKGVINSNCPLDDNLALATITDKKFGDIWAVHDNSSGSYRQYVWNDHDWLEVCSEDLNNLSIEDLLEYLYDVREYLDDHTKSVSYSTKQEAEQKTRAILGTARDKVQFVIEKIRSTTKIEREEKH